MIVRVLWKWRSRCLQKPRGRAARLPSISSTKPFLDTCGLLGPRGYQSNGIKCPLCLMLLDYLIHTAQDPNE